MIEHVPYRTVDLLRVLDEAYPHRCPNPSDTEREIWMKAGERRLIDLLLNRMEKDDVLG